MVFVHVDVDGEGVVKEGDVVKVGDFFDYLEASE